MGISSNFVAHAMNLRHIKNNPLSKRRFNLAMIAGGLISLHDAQTQLSAEQYGYVHYLYTFFSKMNKVFELDLHGYLHTGYMLIAYYDMVVPYYQICGSQNLKITALDEKAKLPYRIQAQQLISEYGISKALSSSEWVDLYNKFFAKFYEVLL